MKSALLAAILILYGGNLEAQARSFYALNPKVEQGGTLVFQISPYWMPPATSNPTIFIFEKHYKPNGQGKVFVGVGLDTQPGKHIATFNENGLRSGWDYEEIEVLATTFEKTRTSRYTGRLAERTDRQKRTINNAFNSNLSDEDLTDSSPYIYPLDLAKDIIDPFGFIYENNPYRTHDGVDLRAPVGTSVKAVNKGKVILVARRFRNEGNMLIISHGSGIFSIYMHLSKFGKLRDEEIIKGVRRLVARDLRVGDIVERGQMIALSGRTGRGVHEPHLHWNMKVGGDTYVDPFEFVETVNQYLSR